MSVTHQFALKGLFDLLGEISIYILIISIYIDFWVDAALCYMCIYHSVLSGSWNCASQTFCINTEDNTALTELKSCCTWNKQLPAPSLSALTWTYIAAEASRPQIQFLRNKQSNSLVILMEIYKFLNYNFHIIFIYFLYIFKYFIYFIFIF